jgi:methionyl aminopeptidase
MAKELSAAELEILRAGGRRLSAVLAAVGQAVRPGITTGELDQLARQLIAAGGDEPSFLNYQPAGAYYPFPAALCVSVNEEVVHGLPGPRVLRSGDIVSLDLGLKHQGLFTDMAITVPVGEVSAAAERLLQETRRALARGIAAARAGERVGVIGAAVEAWALQNNLGLVRDLGGHGLGRRIHMPPQVPNYGPAASGPRLKPGQVIAIEPMLTLGADEVIFLPDGYTVKTADDSLAAHFEQTVLITPAGAEIITPFPPEFLAL